MKAASHVAATKRLIGAKSVLGGGVHTVFLHFYAARGSSVGRESPH